MTEKELLELCKEPKRNKQIFWTSEVYGFGTILRKFGFYPASLPLNVYFAHGVTVGENPAPHELSNKAPVMLYFTPRLVTAYKRVSKKPCYCIISPNVYYRKSNSIRQDSAAKGTLAFFSHTTPVIDNTMDVSLYIHQLKSLPERYQPVSVCLHYHDVNKGFHKLFIQESMNVMTVGHPSHPDFIKRFYEMIRYFRFLTSNEIGSYAFYGPEAGIPFFLYGAEPVLYNNSDPNIEMGIYNSFKLTEQYRKVQSLFIIPSDVVTPEQKRFVEQELGVYHSISRLRFSAILYTAYFTYLMKNTRNRIIKKIKLNV